MALIVEQPPPLVTDPLLDILVANWTQQEGRPITGNSIFNEQSITISSEKSPNPSTDRNKSKITIEKMMSSCVCDHCRHYRSRYSSTIQLNHILVWNERQLTKNICFDSDRSGHTHDSLFLFIRFFTKSVSLLKFRSITL